MKTAVEKAAEILKGKGKLAAAIDVTPQAISNWISEDRPVPVERCVQIEQVTLGAVMRWDLRPDDWARIWPELAERPDAPRTPSITEAA